MNTPGAKTPIRNGYLQSDLDCKGFTLLNLDITPFTLGFPLIDSSPIIKGSADATKLLRFEIDGFTTATTRVITVPNYNGTLVTLAGTETLTNKALVAVSAFGIQSPGVGALKIAVGAAVSADRTLTIYTDNADRNIQITGDLIIGPFETTLNTTGPTAVTLPTSGTLATVAGTEPALGNPAGNGYILSSTTLGVRSWIANSSANPFFDDTAIIKNKDDATKLLKISASGITTGTTRTLTAPNYNGTIATLAGIETFTNKTLDGGTLNQISVLGLNDPASIYQVLLTGNDATSANRTLGLFMNNGNRRLIMSGDINISANLSTIGADDIDFLTTGPTSITLPESGTLATVAQLGTNPFTDLNPILLDKDDDTKKLRIDVGGITTGNTRVLSVPDFDGTISTIAGIETLANKTLVNSPVVGLVNATSGFDLQIVNSDTTASAARVLSVNLNNADKLISLTGNLLMSGAFNLTLTVTAHTNVTLPTTGTVEARVGVPASAGAAGVAGQVAYAAGFGYRCVATNTWERWVTATW